VADTLALAFAGLAAAAASPTIPVIAEIDTLPSRVWERNRRTNLVGFKIDARGRLIGETRVSKAGLTRAEFNVYLHATAAECDRFEYLLTGLDAS
jgi:hypothetical protein